MQVGKQLGAEWNKLSDKQKAKYEKVRACFVELLMTNF